MIDSLFVTRCRFHRVRGRLLDVSCARIRSRPKWIYSQRQRTAGGF